VAIYIKSNLVRSYFFLGLYFVLYITSFALSLSNQNQAFNHAVVLICTKYVYAGGQNCCTNHIKVPAAHQHLFTLMSIWNQWKMLHVLEHSQNNNKKRRKKKGGDHKTRLQSVDESFSEVDCFPERVCSVLKMLCISTPWDPKEPEWAFQQAKLGYWTWIWGNCQMFFFLLQSSA